MNTPWSGASHIAGALHAMLFGTKHWASRWDIAWYVSRCEMAGFCNTDDMRRQCALRYIAGKRELETRHP